MMLFFRKHMKTIFAITAITFFAGIFIGFGAYFYSGGGLGTSIAEVNGTKIPYKKYNDYLQKVIENLRSTNVDITEEVVKKYRDETIGDLLREEIFHQEAQKYGVTVSDEELASNIQRIPAFQKDNRFNQQIYFQILAYRLKQTPQEFEDSQRRYIEREKLNYLIASSVKVTEKEVLLEYSQETKGNLKNFSKDKAGYTKNLSDDKVRASFIDWQKALFSSIKYKVNTELLSQGSR